MRLGPRLRPSNKKVVRQNFQKFQARGSLKQNLKNRKIENQGAGKKEQGARREQGLRSHFQMKKFQLFFRYFCR